MNLDKKLAKYARHLDNPKYYDKITKILMKADKSGYQFKSFNDFDMMKISGELAAYYDAITTDEEHKRMVRYYNKHWFIISDKNYILWETKSLIIALGFMARAFLMMFFIKLSQLIAPESAFDTKNIDYNMYLIHGRLNAAEFFGCKIDEVEERKILYQIFD